MIAKRAREMKPFYVMEILEKAQALEREGHDVVHLEVGEPDFDTPEPIKEACREALKEGKTHYTHSQGILELREAICEVYYENYGVEVTPDQVLITSGTSPAMLLLFSALLEEGDEVILPDPTYPCYPNFIRYLRAMPLFVKTEEDEGFRYDLEEVKASLSPRTKAIIVNSPSNPTGVVMEEERLREMASLPYWIVSDEIYHGLVYEGKEHTMLEFTDRCFVLNGFSKLYAMTGWRLGYVIAPREFIRPMQVMQQNFFISPNAFVQWAALAALREAKEYAEGMRHEYNRRRLLLLEGLRKLGLRVKVEPTGAFYILANARHISEDSRKLAFDILEKAKVGVTPGIDFGQQAEGYLRFSYTTSQKRIREGLRRLEEYLKGFQGLP